MKGYYLVSGSIMVVPDKGGGLINYVTTDGLHSSAILSAIPTIYMHFVHLQLQTAAYLWLHNLLAPFPIHQWQRTTTGPLQAR